MMYILFAFLNKLMLTGLTEPAVTKGPVKSPKRCFYMFKRTYKIYAIQIRKCNFIFNLRFYVDNQS